MNENDICNLQVGEMTVNFVYSENGKTLSECIFNILKQKKEGK